MASQWQSLMSRARDLARRASQATREELERIAQELEAALGSGVSELERKRLWLHKRIIESARASKEPALLGKEVIAADGVSLGTMRDFRLELESKRVWLVVGKAFGEPRNIASDDIQAIGDKVILSVSEEEINLKEEV